MTFHEIEIITNFGEYKHRDTLPMPMKAWKVVPDDLSECPYDLAVIKGEQRFQNDERESIWRVLHHPTGMIIWSGFMAETREQVVERCVEEWTAKLTKAGYVQGQMLFDGTEECMMDRYITGKIGLPVINGNLEGSKC